MSFTKHQGPPRGDWATGSSLRGVQNWDGARKMGTGEGTQVCWGAGNFCELEVEGPSLKVKNEHSIIIASLSLFCLSSGGWREEKEGATKRG